MLCLYRLPLQRFTNDHGIIVLLTVVLCIKESSVKTLALCIEPISAVLSRGLYTGKSAYKVIKG